MNVIKPFPNYVVSFNLENRFANYSLYYLETRVKRAKCRFFSDELPTHEHAEFKKFKMDRGHLTPAIDVQNSKSTFHMANIAPQYPSFNRGIWKNVEEYVRKNFMFHHVLTVVDFQNHFVPTGFYKIIIDRDVVWSLYLEHEEKMGSKCFKQVGKQKLPTWFK